MMRARKSPPLSPDKDEAPDRINERQGSTSKDESRPGRTGTIYDNAKSTRRSPYLPYILINFVAFALFMFFRYGGGGKAAKIYTDKRYYAPSETIVVTFKNPDAKPMDWIALYPAEANFGRALKGGASKPATKWAYPCDEQNPDCYGKGSFLATLRPIPSGTITFEGGTGSRKGGTFRVHYVREGEMNARESLAFSAEITVEADTSPTRSPTIMPTDKPTEEPTDREPTNEPTTEPQKEQEEEEKEKESEEEEEGGEGEEEEDGDDEEGDDEEGDDEEGDDKEGDDQE